MEGRASWAGAEAAVLTALLGLVAAWAWWARRRRLTEGPRAARWLAEAWQPARPDRKTPHWLRGKASGLRPLPEDERWVVVEEDEAYVRQMRLKRALIEGELDSVDPELVRCRRSTANTSPKRFYTSMAAAEDTAPATPSSEVLEAEAECLQMLLALLGSDARYRRSHKVVRDRSNGQAVEVIDLLTNRRFEVAAYASCPLRLCSLLVQEDFILLSPAGEGEAGGFRFVAGCATYSFMEIGLRGAPGNMRLGEPLPFIHQNVPGFNGVNNKGGILTMVVKFFQQLQPGKPFFRTNWICVPHAQLNPLLFDLEGDGLREDGAYFSSTGLGKPTHQNLRVEHQIIQVLPQSRHLLFSIHTYSTPIKRLDAAPKAASVLRQAILALDSDRLKYRGMPPIESEWTQELLAQLAGLAGERAG